MLQKVENRVRVLVDLRELASAESPDSFTLVYTNILEHQPDCPVSAIYLYYAYHTYLLVVSILTSTLSTLQPEVVDKLVSLREGIPRKDAKEVSKTELNHTRIQPTRAFLDHSKTSNQIHFLTRSMLLFFFCGAGCSRVQRNLWKLSRWWQSSEGGLRLP